MTHSYARPNKDAWLNNGQRYNCCGYEFLLGVDDFNNLEAWIRGAHPDESARWVELNSEIARYRSGGNTKVALREMLDECTAIESKMCPIIDEWVRANLPDYMPKPEKVKTP